MSDRARTSSRRGGVLGVKVREGLETRDDLGVVHPRLEHLLDFSREAGRERHRACVDDARGGVPRRGEIGRAFRSVRPTGVDDLLLACRPTAESNEVREGRIRAARLAGP